jgi:putative transposase
MQYFKFTTMSGDRYHIDDQNGVYFLTFTIVGWLDVFIRKKYKRVILESLSFCIENKGLELYAWCLMSSHIHIIASAKEGHGLSAFIRDFKKHTAKQIIKLIDEQDESRRKWLLWYFEREGKKDKRITKYKFWQEDNHAIFLDRNQIEMIKQKVDYIHQNPVVEEIVENEEDYLYSSARNFAGLKGLIELNEL